MPAMINSRQLPATCDATITRRISVRSSVRDTFWPPSLIASIKCCCATFHAGSSPTTTSDRRAERHGNQRPSPHSMLKSM